MNPNMTIFDSYSSVCASSDAPASSMAPSKNAHSHLEPTDDSVEMKKIIVTLKDSKIVFSRNIDGTWSVAPKTRPKFLGRRVGNAKRYAEALKRKRKRASTAFGRLRRRHIREMHSRSWQSGVFKSSA